MGTFETKSDEELLKAILINYPEFNIIDTTKEDEFAELKSRKKWLYYLLMDSLTTSSDVRRVFLHLYFYVPYEKTVIQKKD